MLLVLDVGNTNTVLGVYELDGGAGRLIAHWRVATVRTHTVDEYGVLFRNLFAIGKVASEDVRGIIVSSVVPPMDSTLREVCERYFHLKPLFVEPGIKTGMPVQYENPQEVGADRIVNGVAAYHKYGGPCVVADFGTAITFDAISARGEYVGGIICPGIGISSEALFSRTARLPRIDFREPLKLIGTNTVASMQSGLFYGALGQVDGILSRLIEVLGPETKCVATGGQASLIARASHYLKSVDENLTLDGLRLIWEKNR
jgi:type III pantothenate kinase